MPPTPIDPANPQPVAPVVDPAKYSAVGAGDDGVCFTSGLPGAPMGAGVIHAYLASDRRPPLVVAGISMGALSAAAMQRSYRELNRAKNDPDAGGDAVERARWEWFRTYLDFLTYRPFDVIWNAIPDPSDFLSELPPVKEVAIPGHTPEEQEMWEQRESEARYALLVHVKLGRWLARLPITVGRLVGLLIHYVRYKEGYPPGWLARAQTKTQLLLAACWVFANLQLHTARHPQFLREPSGRGRPLLGWPIWLVALVYSVLMPLPWLLAVGPFLLSLPAQFNPVEILKRLSSALERLSQWLSGFSWVNLTTWFREVPAPWSEGTFFALAKRMQDGLDGLGNTARWAYAEHPWLSLSLAVSFVVFLAPGALLFGKSGGDGFGKKLRDRLFRHFGKAVGMEKAFLDDFTLRMWLHQLFREDENPVRSRNPLDPGQPAMLRADPMPALLVCAPLQMFASVDEQRHGQAPYPTQVWASNSPTGSVRVEDALRAALAVPGLFAPVHVSRQPRKGQPRGGMRIQDWLSNKTETMEAISHLDLVDGGVVRQNPLPALFSFLSSKNNQHIADKITSRTFRVLEPEPEPDDHLPAVRLVYSVPIHKKHHPPVSQGVSDPEPPLPDIVQTAFSGFRLQRRRDSRMEMLRTNFITQIESCIPETCKVGLPVWVDEIAPEADFKSEVPLNPTETEILVRIAEGCRQTLGVVWKDKLQESRNCQGEVYCPAFLAKVAPNRNGCWNEPDIPGLSEVCRHCTKVLKPNVPEPARAISLEFDNASRGKPAGDDRKKLLETFGFLSGEQPRVVVLLSGGVFRGSFHIGMIGALLAINLRPDLIAGASVGTLMGGALGAVFSEPDYPLALVRLGRITHLFHNVDRDVALTKTFKSAARDLGIRGSRIDLSPNQLRKIVARGAAGDPGLAAAGAPPPLMDAISELFLIPLDNTRQIASAFVGGQVARASVEFFQQVRAHSLEQLGIREALIGTSLLEPQVRKLAGSAHWDLGLPHPFLMRTGHGADRKIAFFATTVHLQAERTTSLGTEVNRQSRSYDFVQAGLASSAFPAVFAPRRDSEVYPGLGARDVFYFDGGAFDNLPFVPVLQLLGGIQRAYADTQLRQWDCFLRQRWLHPDLFLVGALSERPQADLPAQYQTLLEIVGRAGRLADNEKIYAYKRSSAKIDRQLAQLQRLSIPPLTAHQEKLLNLTVNAAVLAAFPTDKNHLNGSFEFCASLGMDRAKIGRSIADGCFQTLHGIATNLEEGLQRGRPPEQLPLVARSLRGLHQLGILPAVERNGGGGGLQHGQCPFFVSNADPQQRLGERPAGSGDPRRFVCPFFAAAGALAKNPGALESTQEEGEAASRNAEGIYCSCIHDPAHFVRPKNP